MVLTPAQEPNELRSVSLPDLSLRIVGQGGQALASSLSQPPPDSAFFTSLLIATALAGSTHSMITVQEYISSKEAANFLELGSRGSEAQELTLGPRKQSGVLVFCRRSGWIQVGVTVSLGSRTSHCLGISVLLGCPVIRVGDRHTR